MNLESTSDAQLNTIAKKMKIINFGGVLSNDLVKLMKPNTNKVYVLNLQNSNQEGSHWVCLDCRKPRICYVDSYGVLPTREVTKWILETKRPAIYSKVNIQGYDDSSCGYYALWFAKQLQSKTLKSILEQFSQDSNRNENFLEKNLANYNINGDN